MIQRWLYLSKNIYDKCLRIFVYDFVKNKCNIRVTYTYHFFFPFSYFYTEFLKRFFFFLKDTEL